MQPAIKIVGGIISGLATGLTIKSSFTPDKITITNRCGVKISVYVQKTGSFESNGAYTLAYDETENWGRNTTNGAVHILLFRHDTHQYLWMELMPPAALIFDRDLLDQPEWTQDTIFPSGMFAF